MLCNANFESNTFGMEFVEEAENHKKEGGMKRMEQDYRLKAARVHLSL